MDGDCGTTKGQWMELEVADMKILKFLLGVTKRDRIRSKSIEI